MKQRYGPAGNGINVGSVGSFFSEENGQSNTKKWGLYFMMMRPKTWEHTVDDLLIPREVMEAALAIKHGAVWRGFDGPDGITKDEALGYAAVLAEWVLSNG